MNVLLIIDIDGTISNGKDRFTAAGPEPSRSDREVYQAWVGRVQDKHSLLADEPVPGMSELIYGFIEGGFNDAVYLTSREYKWAGVTMEWLAKNNFPSLELVMRGETDYRESADFKEDKIKRLLKSYQCETAVVLDDDEKGTIEDMCKRNRYTFLKARSGGQK